jgi:hypothetical protein
LLTGRYDFVMPYESSQRPLFELLGPRPPHKHHKLFDTGHALPVGDIQSVILPWLDRYLSPAAQ